jgi:outer membrane immunogenic protein
MKKIDLHVAAISVLFATSAGAADLRPAPVKAPAPVPVAVYNWTGCYVGAGGGYGMFDQRQRYLAPAPQPESWDNGGRGWFGTAQVGCDYQFGSNIVIGAFGDYDWSGIRGDITNPFFGAVVAREKLKSSWAAGGRVGWLPFQQLLVFVSGGYTQARFSQIDYQFTGGGGPVGLSLPKHTYSGWFIGTGYEYGLGFLPGLFWKTEYRFADYSSDILPVVFTANGAPRGDSVESRKYVHTVRSEIVWRFNFGGPVVARY